MATDLVFDKIGHNELQESGCRGMSLICSGCGLCCLDVHQLRQYTEVETISLTSDLTAAVHHIAQCEYQS